jgi:DNA mismatch endonuclease (patch repair protein)
MAVFVDGCFWHRCPIHLTNPKANSDWWRSKLEANGRRDEDTDRKLHQVGWTVLRFWEHEDPVACARTIEATVSSIRADKAPDQPKSVLEPVST